MNSLRESIQKQSNKEKNILNIQEDEESTYNRRCIGYILKILVNINGTSDGTSNDDNNIYQINFNNTQLGSNIRILTTIDDIILFYSNLLGII